MHRTNGAHRVANSIIRAFFLKNNGVAIKMMRAMNARLNELQTEQQQLVGQDEQHRGKMFLLKLVEHYGKFVNGELRIGIPMSQQDFANTIGCTREKGNRFLRQLRNEGIADMHRSGFVIHDLRVVKALAGKINPPQKH